MSDAKNTANLKPDGNEAEPELTVSASDSAGRSSIDPHSIEGLFLLALQKETPGEREAFINDVCGRDSEHRRRVTALLRAYDDAGSFLETPAVGARPLEEVSLSFLKPVDNEDSLGTIGPYEALEVIGRGGMGVVLRAIDPKLNRIVAVKVLLPDLAVNPNARRRFLREAQAAAAVSHPHVVTIHAVEEASHENGQQQIPPYLVMECVAGQSLQHKLDIVGTLRLTEILRISRQVAEGLAAAHKQGLIHRDIKPANILLENGVERVKITDFGLARAIDDITVTRTGEVSGTPQYMSPEQANGERVDHRSDLFSLGSVMYAMCSGHSPFRGDSLVHVIKRVTQDTPRPIMEQNSEIPPWLAEIIDCLLQKDPDDRFQSAEGLVAILDEHLVRIQQPVDSGSHSLINQRAPVRSTATDSGTTAAAPGPHIAQKAQLGAVLIGVGATIIFCLVAWMLLVAFEVIGATQQIREMAASIVGVSLSVAFLFVAAGSLLREEILGHRTWINLVQLAFCTLLGPIGIWYWVSRRTSQPQNRSPTPDGQDPARLSGGATHQRNERRSPPEQNPSLHPAGTWLQFACRLLICAIVGVSFSSIVIPNSIISTNPQLAEERLVRFVCSIAAILVLACLFYRLRYGAERPMKNWLLQTAALMGTMCLGFAWMTVGRAAGTSIKDLEITIYLSFLWSVFCVFAGSELRQSPDRRVSKPGDPPTDGSAVIEHGSHAEQSESIHGAVGRHLMLHGVFLFILPVAVIFTGIVTDGDVMQFGGELLVFASPIGLLAIVAGYILRFVVDREQDTHRRMSFAFPLVMAVFIAATGAFAHTAWERSTESSRDSENNGQRNFDSLMQFVDPVDGNVPPHADQADTGEGSASTIKSVEPVESESHRADIDE